MRGIDSDVVGTASAINTMNIENVRKTVRPSPIFSRELLGRQNVRSVSELSMTHGTMTLNA